MDQYRVTDGRHSRDFTRSTRESAVAQAHGLLTMNPTMDSDCAELEILEGEIWQRVDLVRNLPEQAGPRGDN